MNEKQSQQLDDIIRLSMCEWIPDGQVEEYLQEELNDD